MEYNTIVIGAGPAGMSAALYLKRSGLSVLLIDKDAPGGKMLKAKSIDNYLGFGSINGADLALKMYEHVRENEIPFEFGEVKEILKNEKYVVKFADKEFVSSNIVIATGRMKKNNLFKGINGISTCAICDGTLYKNKVVAVYGDEAINDALYLSDLCRKVYLVSNEKQELKDNIISIVGEIKNVTSENEVITGIILSGNTEYKVDALFMSENPENEFNLLKGLDLENGYIKIDKNMKTNLSNVYACGDAVYKDFYQVSTAVAEGAIAALSIKVGERK